MDIDKPEIATIVAIDDNYSIGDGDKMLWHIPEDLKHFKELTDGHVVIMGRKTCESLPKGYLPNRINIVLTRNKDYKPINDKVVVYNSLDELLQDIKILSIANKIFIIGGSQIYSLFSNIINKLYITRVHGSYNGDIKFPYDKYFNNDNKWTKSYSKTYNTENNISFTFEEYDK